MQYLSNIGSIALLVFGFGFVIFWHELGHFAAAKWVGIRVEQFAVGFGQAFLAWRKGIGFRVGTTTPEYERRIRKHIEAKQATRGTTAPNSKTEALVAAGREAGSAEPARDDRRELSGEGNQREQATAEELGAEPTPEQMNEAAAALGLGETEYRLNWIPLGGYVKMLGQDDLDPNSVVNDPRAYNRKSIGARMIVVSAGVVMNVILAAILFMGLFTFGFRAPPAIVGSVQTGSPAQKTYRLVDGKPQPAPIQVGDTILTYDGDPMYDWTKIQLAAALSEEGQAIPLEVQHFDGKTETLYIKPTRSDPTAGMGLSLGIGPAMTLEGLDKDLAITKDAAAQRVAADYTAVGKNEKITAVDGKQVDPKKGYSVLSDAIQQAGLAGKPLPVTVTDENGGSRAVLVNSYLGPVYGDRVLDFAGMTLRPAIFEIQAESPAIGKLRPGDVVTRISSGGDPVDNPSGKRFRERVEKAGAQGQKVTLTVLRRDAPEPLTFELDPTFKIKGPRHSTRGLGVGLGEDLAHPVIADVLDNTPAKAAGIEPGSTIVSVLKQPVQSWNDVHRLLLTAQAAHPIPLTIRTPAGEMVEKSLTLSPDDAQFVAGIRYQPMLALKERIEPRVAKNVLQAGWWGVLETRDFILQFYLTIRRMVDGTVSPTNLMGPYGIFKHGAMIAFKGNDWLTWYLAMISANLAVVNFLPIPIVDGGLFVFLILEKLKGRPLSPRTQSIAQVVGLALLLGIFLFVTYHDIMRDL